MHRVPESFADPSMFSSPNISAVIEYRISETTPPRLLLFTQPTLVFVRRGSKRVRPSGQQDALEVTEGYVFALRSGTHSMAEQVAEQTDFASTIVCIDRVTLSELMDGCDPVRSDERAVSLGTSPALAAQFDRVSSATQAAGAERERELAIRGLIDAALSVPSAASLLAAELDAWGNTNDDRIRAVVNAHYLSPIGLEQFAELSAMSVSSFKRHFRRVFGAPPGRWLIDARLHHASMQLARTTLPITTVCEASGYGDLTNFIRAFGMRYGMSPTAFRSKYSVVELHGQATAHICR